MKRTLYSFYPLALAEGEGVGTAYEYVAKRRALFRWLGQQTVPRSLLIAGLPELYGSSLDYLILAADWGVPLYVAERSADLLAKFQRALTHASLPPVSIQLLPLHSWAELADHPCGLAICNEVIQRLSADERTIYLSSLAQSAERTALFCPNGLNPAHNSHSGLASIDPTLLHQWVSRFPQWRLEARGFCDMPPFPPGITRSAEQRQHAQSGLFERLAMYGLDWFTHGERWIPAPYLQKKAHITYAFCRQRSTPLK